MASDTRREDAKHTLVCELSEQQRRTKFRGGLAQLGEHLLCKQGVVGSIPSSSTNPLRGGAVLADGILVNTLET